MPPRNYRAKRIDTGEWVYGYYTATKHSDCGPESWIWYADSLRAKVDPATLGQFTGRLDKASKEIFSGDKVEYYLDEFIVIWDDHYGYIVDDPHAHDTGSDGTLTLSMCSSVNLEVIGTVHDTPPNLTEGEK